MYNSAAQFVLTGELYNVQDVMYNSEAQFVLTGELYKTSCNAVLCTTLSVMHNSEVLLYLQVS